MHNRLLSFFVFVATTTIVAADAPFFGSWKLSSNKTDFTTIKIKFEQAANGQIKETDQGGLITTFKLDGNDYPTPAGGTVAWKQRDANAWETVSKVNGKVVETDVATLSPDGKTMTVSSTMVAADGKSSEGLMTLERVSGGPGLIGEWKGTQNVKMPTDMNFDIASHGPDGVALTFTPPGMVCDVKMDGRDYPCSGSVVPPGITLAFKQTGPDSFELVQKKDGNVVATIHGTVSGDGKTLTSFVALGDASTADKMKFVYDRVAPKPRS